MNRDINQLKQELNSKFVQIARLKVEQAVKDDLARYLCIRVSGFLERSIQSLLVEYVARQTQRNERVYRYVTQRLQGFRNPNFEDIVILLSSFDLQWGQQLRDSTSPTDKEAISNLVGVRNLLAHGVARQISLMKVRDGYKVAIQIVELIEQLTAEPEP